MDDFDVSALHESKNEWAARLVTILTPLVIDGYKSILDEAVKLCKDNGELDKYLMTFQNFISRVPKWNPQIIENERKRICEKSGCAFLEELITCVHIIQLKILTAMRVGQKQKKININVPKLDEFLHKVYVNVARKAYKNVYLFELNIPPLQTQKNYRELEIIVQECILNTVRESIPVEAILKAYMDETVEEDVVEEIKEQIIEPPAPPAPVSATATSTAETAVDTNAGGGGSGLSFSDIDYIKGDAGVEEVQAPKTIERLEEISELRNQQRKLEQEEEDEGDKIKILDEPAMELDMSMVQSFDEPAKMETFPELVIDDVEVLE